MLIAAHSASACSVGMSITGGTALPIARLVWRKKPGTEKTHSTSTMFVTIVGTEIPTSEATEGYEAGAAWRRTTSRGRTPFATPVRT